MQNINSLTEKLPTARERMNFQTRTVYCLLFRIWPTKRALSIVIMNASKLKSLILLAFDTLLKVLYNPCELTTFIILRHARRQKVQVFA